jgi:hypothetical protein
LIVLGNAGLVAVVASLVASFTQVAGFGWFFIQLGIIIVSIFVLYRLIIGSRTGNRLLGWLRRPLINRMIQEAPVLEEVTNFGRGWGIYLTTVRQRAKCVGMRVSAVGVGTDIDILAIDRPREYLPREEHLRVGDRLLVYGRETSVVAFLGS